VFAPATGGLDLSRRLTRALQACRADLMQPWVPPIADVLHYQRHGAEARAFVLDALAATDGPCLVLGESFGAVLAMDVLTSGAPMADVRGLVSVGAQVAVLYEMHALQTLVPDGNAEPFDPWLNIYNPFDFASFLAAPAWPQAGIRDVAIDDGRHGFPRAHIAYLENPQTYEAIAEAARDWGF
jgi:hypothetical protein